MKSHGEILLPSPADEDGQVIWLLRCPVCGDDCVEQMGHGGDHAAVTVHPDRDGYDSPIGTRGGYVRIKLFCPAGHGFDLIIANHKGCEYVGIALAGKRGYSGSDDQAS